MDRNNGAAGVSDFLVFPTEEAELREVKTGEYGEGGRIKRGEGERDRENLTANFRKITRVSKELQQMRSMIAQKKPSEFIRRSRSEKNDAAERLQSLKKNREPD